jgi:hypothetical protein
MSQYITLRHATPRTNLRSILSGGLDPARSHGARRVVWLHTPSRTAWAILHTSQRHLVNALDVAIVTVRIPRSWLTRRRRNIWTERCVIDPSRIVSVNPRASLEAAA